MKLVVVLSILLAVPAIFGQATRTRSGPPPARFMSRGRNDIKDVPDNFGAAPAPPPPAAPAPPPPAGGPAPPPPAAAPAPPPPAGGAAPPPAAAAPAPPPPAARPVPPPPAAAPAPPPPAHPTVLKRLNQPPPPRRFNDVKDVPDNSRAGPPPPRYTPPGAPASRMAPAAPRLPPTRTKTLGLLRPYPPPMMYDPYMPTAPTTYGYAGTTGPSWNTYPTDAPDVNKEEEESR